VDVGVAKEGGDRGGADDWKQFNQDMNSNEDLWLTNKEVERAMQWL
jgi:hypothetical protein